jgi:uncharacterized protein YraI
MRRSRSLGGFFTLARYGGDNAGATAAAAGSAVSAHGARSNIAPIADDRPERNTMRRQSRLILAVVLVAVLALPVAVRPAAVGALSCGPCPAATTDALNLRAEPSLSAEILLVMPAGAELEWDPTRDAIDGYVAVGYEGVDGWAHRDYLLLFPVFATTTAPLNLRADPSLDADVLLVMPEGAQAMVLWGPQNGYFSVRYDDRVTGWAHGDYLVLNEHGGDGGTFPTGTFVAVATDQLNLRWAPSLNAGVIDVLPFGAEGTVLEPPSAADGYVWQRVDFGTAYGAGIEALWEGTGGTILAGPVYADGWTWYQLGIPGYGPGGNTPGWVAGEFLGTA